MTCSTFLNMKVNHVLFFSHLSGSVHVTSARGFMKEEILHAVHDCVLEREPEIDLAKWNYIIKQVNGKLTLFGKRAKQTRLFYPL